MFKMLLDLISKLFYKSKPTETVEEKPIGNYVLIVKDDYTKMKMGEYCEYIVSSLEGPIGTGHIAIGNSTRLALKWLNEMGGMDVINRYYHVYGFTPIEAVRYLLNTGCAWKGDLSALEGGRGSNPIVIAYMAWYIKQSKGLKVKIEKWSGNRLVITVGNIYHDRTNETITSGDLITPLLVDRVKMVNELFKDKIIDDINVNGQQHGYWGTLEVAHCIRSALYSKEFNIVGNSIFLDHDNYIKLTLNEEKKDDQATH